MERYRDMNIRLTGARPALRARGSAILRGMREVAHQLPGALRQFSLRRRLGVAALAALLTAATMGTLLLVTAASARNVAEHARQVHSRVQAYSQLIAALRSFQATSYTAVQIASPRADEELDAARAAYLHALDEVRGLPAQDEMQRALAGRIEAQGRFVLAHLSDIEQIVARIDETWRNLGQDAAGAEAQRSAAPVRELEALLNAQILEGDRQIDAATQRTLALNHRVLLACVVCLLLAAASWAIIHGLLLRRLGPGLQRLEQGTLAFAAGNLAHRVRLGGHDELSRLGTAFDTMAQQLAEKQQALQQVQVGLERAVRERTEDLERANRELAASDSRRRAFLADIGHELRTPLTIIRGEAQVALRTVEQPGFNVQEALERIVQHTRDLGRMVDDLFLIARAEAGGLPMQMRRADLRELIQRVAGDYNALAADVGAVVEAVPGPPVHCEVDEDRLRRALAALVDNALRHTRPGVRVELDVRASGAGPTISVSDDGPGIDPEIVPELFQRFRRGHTQGEGSGLGLSLVRALVEAQSGRANLENRPGGGVRAVLEFTHTMPAAREET